VCGLRASQLFDSISFPPSAANTYSLPQQHGGATRQFSLQNGSTCGCKNKKKLPSHISHLPTDSGPKPQVFTKEEAEKASGSQPSLLFLFLHITSYLLHVATFVAESLIQSLGSEGVALVILVLMYRSADRRT
jgi:hypothetical protein